MTFCSHRLCRLGVLFPLDGAATFEVLDQRCSGWGVGCSSDWLRSYLRQDVFHGHESSSTPLLDGVRQGSAVGFNFLHTEEERCWLLTTRLDDWNLLSMGVSGTLVQVQMKLKPGF